MIETVMEATADDHEKTTHEKDSTRETVTKRILASCDDIRCSRTLFGLSCGGFLEYSVFLPFITRGKRFFDTISTQGSMPSPHVSSTSLLSPNTNSIFSFIMVIRTCSTPWFSSSGAGLLVGLDDLFPHLDLFELGEHTLALILEVASEVRQLCRLTI